MARPKTCPVHSGGAWALISEAKQGDKTPKATPDWDTEIEDLYIYISYIYIII